jgi:alanine-synthesizing transaminase
MFSDKFGREPEGMNPHWTAKTALEASGVDILDLTRSNPTLAGIPYPAGLSSLLDRPGTLRYHPDPRGLPEARRAVAGYYASRGRRVDPDHLILTASTSEAYAFLFKLLCNPGDEILIPSPTYPLFDALAELENVNLVRYPLRREKQTGGRWRADFGFLRSLISTRCKALILVHPNNPTGHLADADEMRAYLDLAAEHDLALIVDEVFRDYILGEGVYQSLESDGPLVFTLNGFSKVLGLPQMKLGWIHAAGREAPAALGHLEWIADAFLSVNAPVQAAAADLLASGQAIQSAILDRVKRNLSAAIEIAGPERVLAPDAGWSLILELDSGLDDEAFALGLLNQRHVHAHAGHLFGFEDGCRLVLSLLGPEEEFREGLERILAFSQAMEDTPFG